MSTVAIPHQAIETKIFNIREHKVMLDIHLAQLYGVSTKRLKEQVRRNTRRFPEDFMFTLTWTEVESLRSHFATLKIKEPGRGQHVKYLPYAFTEQGVSMLSSVLNSERAIDVNIAIMRAFVKLREVLATHKELAQKFKELEHRVGRHDEEIQAIFDAIRQLMSPPQKPKGKIGFYKE